MKHYVLTLLASHFIVYTMGQNASKDNYGLERLINEYINTYAFSPANLLRLSAYAELKGEFSSRDNSLKLDFGSNGTITFFSSNFLYRTSFGSVFYMNKGDKNTQLLHTLNQELDRLFEKIDLLSNSNKDAYLVNFIDKSLARKNIEPFEKILTRFILIKYGRYNPQTKVVEFHTDWLPKETVVQNALGKTTLKPHNAPLRMVLDSTTIRGYYINVGGQVYVDNVKRKVAYATGEQYLYNVSAFKLFIQKLFLHTALPVTNLSQPQGLNTPSQGTIAQNNPPKTAHESTSRQISPAALNKVASEKSYDSAPLTASINSEPEIEPLYGKYTWIPALLGRLRSHNIKISDPDILQYLIDQPYFPRIYDLLNKLEKIEVDRFIQRRKKA